MEDMFTLIAATAARHPGAPALIDGETGNAKSYAELARTIDEVAGQLHGLGVAPGSNILSFTSRSSELIELVLGASRLGVGIMPFIGAGHSPGALDHALRVLKPSHVFYDFVGEGYRRERRPGVNWTPLSAIRGARPSILPPHRPDADRILYFNASSGTTGASKLVRATHGQVLANSEAVRLAFDLEPADVHLSCFRHHCHDLFARALCTGGAAVILPAAEDPFEVVRALKRFGVTQLMASPRSLSALETALELSDRKLVLRLVECGGGELWEDLRSRIAHLTGADVVRVWGSTETTGVALAQRPGARLARHCVGWPLPGYRVSVVDPEGQPLGAGEEGQLVVSGPGVAERYLEPNSNLSEHSFRSGDLVCEESGNGFRYLGRCSSTFKVSGIQVNAEVIERAIRLGAPVRETMVVPYPSRRFGHVAVALVVMEPAALVDDIDRVRVAKHLQIEQEMPVAFIPVAEIPTTSGGKPDRRRGAAQLPSRLPGHSGPWRLKPIKTLRLYWRELLNARILVRMLANPAKYLRFLKLEAMSRKSAIQNVIASDALDPMEPQSQDAYSHGDGG